MFLPAVCDNCGTVFQQRMLDVKGSASISNVGISPCPACGGQGHIPDGVYNIIDNVIAVVQAPEHSRADLERIAEIFRRARQEKANRDEVATKIKGEAPGFSQLADLLPRNRSDLYAFLQVVLAAITLYLALKTSSPSVTVNQVINQITIGAPKAPESTAAKKDGAAKQFNKSKRRVKKGERQAKRAQR